MADIKKAGIYFLAQELEKKASSWADRWYEATGKHIPKPLKYVLAGLWDLFDIVALLILAPLSWAPGVGLLFKGLRGFLDNMEILVGVTLSGRHGLVTVVVELLDSFPGGHALEAILPLQIICVHRSEGAEKKEKKNIRTNAAQTIVRAVTDAVAEDKSPMRVAAKAMDQFKEGTPAYEAADRVVRAVEADPTYPIEAAKAEKKVIEDEEKAEALDDKKSGAGKSVAGWSIWGVVGIAFLVGVGLAIFTGVRWIDIVTTAVICLVAVGPVAVFWPRIKPWLISHDLWKSSLQPITQQIEGG